MKCKALSVRQRDSELSHTLICACQTIIVHGARETKFEADSLLREVINAGHCCIWMSQYNKNQIREPIQLAVLLHKWKVGESICVLHVDDIPWGTGFVVGNGHVMTCLHTIKFMFDIRAHTEDCIQQKINQHIHRLKISFEYNFASSRNDNTSFGFEQCEMYFDINLDVIVLKIDRSSRNCQYLPGPLTRFCDLLRGRKFDLFGHPLGKEKIFDENCMITPLSDFMTGEKRNGVAQYLIGKGYNLNAFPEPYDGIQNNGSYLFHTGFGVGGSGSPGITFSEMRNPNDQTYAVGTVLCGEYANFGSNHIPHEDLNTDLKIHFGTKMSSIFSSMKQKSPLLLSKVFKVYPSQWNQ